MKTTSAGDWIGAARKRHQRAFSLVETVVGMVMVGMTCLALYSGMTFGMKTLQGARETERATQIMEEKLDTVRLYAWDKILTSGYIPQRFTNQFALADAGLAGLGYTSGGFNYYGTITVASNLTVSPTYKKDLLQITISLSWTNGSMPHQASMTTFVARYGLYTYVY